MSANYYKYSFLPMVLSFCAVLFPRGVLDEILNLIESVSEDFPSYSCELNRLPPSIVILPKLTQISAAVKSVDHHLP